MQFDFTVENKILTPLDGDNTVIADNSDYFVRFSFDEEWAGKTKTVRFINGKNYVDVLLPSDNTVAIPIEVMAPPSISIGVYSGTLRTSSPVTVKCRASILTPNGTPKSPTDDIYSQILSKYDEASNALLEMNGRVSSVVSAEEERKLSEEKRQSAEEQRQLLYRELKESEGAFSNAYIMNIIENQNNLTVDIEHCIVGDEPHEFYVMGRFTEMEPSGGKAPESPSNIKFPSVTRLTFGDAALLLSNIDSISAIPEDVTDILDVKNGKFIKNIGAAQFHILDGEIYIFDTVRRVYGKKYELRRVDSTSGANVFTDNPDAYPFGKAGSKTFSPYFKTADSIDACEHGYMYDGDGHCFGYGEKSATDEEAYLAFYQFVKALYENGTPLTVYYEYGEPLVTELKKFDLRFTAPTMNVGARRNPFVIRYKADIHSLVNGLQAQINELASAIVTMAEGGDNNA